MGEFLRLRDVTFSNLKRLAADGEIEIRFQRGEK
jgi:hypothetical protein